MKKIMLVSALTLAFLVTLVPISNSEMAKEGSGTGSAYYHGTFKVVAIPKERVQMNYEVFAISRADREDSLLHNASGHCLGSLHAIKGIYEDGGFCEYTRPDGDKIFFTYEAKGGLGKSAKGTFTFVSGTGKCVGITGGGEFTRYALKPPAKGKFATYSISKVNWKIP